MAELDRTPTVPVMVPLTSVNGPTVSLLPARSSVALVMVRAVAAGRAFAIPKARVPPLTVVAPVYVLAPESVVFPVPAMVRAPAPEIGELTVKGLLPLLAQI